MAKTDATKWVYLLYLSITYLTTWISTYSLRNILDNLKYKIFCFEPNISWHNYKIYCYNWNGTYFRHLWKHLLMNEYIFSEQCNESPLTSHKLNFIATLIGLINASYNRLLVMDTFFYLWSNKNCQYKNFWVPAENVAYV